jgi:RNA polymerase sigma-32 factor
LSGKDPEVLPPLEEASSAEEDPREEAIAIDVDTEAHEDSLADGSLIVNTDTAPVPIPLDLIPDDDSASLPTAPGQGSALSNYMAQLSHHAPISREDEHDLAVRWTEDGDVDAGRRLVLSNMRLVVKIAMEYRRAWTNTLDLIQEGNMGLMEAVQRYDPYQGVRLSSYAVYWVRAYILKYILDNMRSVRLGTTRASRKLFFQLNKEKERLQREGFEVSPKLIAERLDVSEDDVLEMENRLSRPDTYLDTPVRRGDEEGRATVGDGFATQGESAESALGSAELQQTFQREIENFAAGLKDRDKQILYERLLQDEPRTLADMGKEFGVSRERVRQLEARLIEQLRAHMQESMVDFEFYQPQKKD